MKKGVFSVMHYYMPKLHNVLTLHSSANQGKDGDGKKFFFFLTLQIFICSLISSIFLYPSEHLLWIEWNRKGKHRFI